jgi:hypothetical protein
MICVDGFFPGDVSRRWSKDASSVWISFFAPRLLVLQSCGAVAYAAGS